MELQQMMVLVVENDEEWAALIGDILERAGVRVHILSDGRAVRETARKLGVDLVILDLALPGADGWEVLSQLRRPAEDDSFQPILVVTSDPAEETKRKALSNGASDFLTKPFEHWELSLRARNLLHARALSLRAIRQTEQLRALIDLQRETISAHPESVYQSVLESAVRTVPGAEAGSLLVRVGKAFHFRAAIGYDLETLKHVVIQSHDLEQWHGGGPREWQRGEPRVMSRDSVSFTELSTTEDELAPELEQAGRLGEIASNLYLPVVYRGNVLAVVNLDNMRDPHAFDEEAIEAARLFGPTVAVLLHESRYRRLLSEAAMTDSLTSIGNRRTFDRALAKQLARSERYGYPFSLIIMDLRNFKQINDELGHGIGDQMLIRVAEVLATAQREGDTLARWGGDEFTVLLPSTGAAAARETSLRYASLIEGIAHGEHRLGVNIGVATYPEDGDNPKQLLAAADRRMYAAKGRDRTVLEGDD